jgi:hypothetical protein
MLYKLLLALSPLIRALPFFIGQASGIQNYEKLSLNMARK